MQSYRVTRSPRWRRRGQVLTDHRQELTWAVGLGNVAVATRGTGLAVIPGQRIGGDDDDGNGMQYRVGLDSARRLVAVDARELDIHEYQVRLVLRRRCQARLAIFGFDDFEIGAREQISQDLPIVFLMLDYQDALAHDRPAA